MYNSVVWHFQGMDFQYNGLKRLHATLMYELQVLKFKFWHKSGVYRRTTDSKFNLPGIQTHASSQNMHASAMF